MTNLLSIFLLFVVRKIIVDISIGHFDSNVISEKSNLVRIKL